MAKSFNKLIHSKYANFLLPFIATIVLFVIWEIVVIAFKIPQFNLPSPTNIFNALITNYQAVIENSTQTLLSTLAGFVLAILAGVFLGFLIGYSRLAYIVLYPLLVGFNTIPKVALVPLFAIWFGIGTVPAVLTAFLLAFFPIAVNVAVGLDTVEVEMKDVLRSLGASDLEIFSESGTASYDALSVCVSESGSLTGFCGGAVISETLASNRGIGYLMVSASSNFDVPLGFAGLLVLAVMGIVLYGIFAALEKYIIHWAR